MVDDPSPPPAQSARALIRAATTAALATLQADAAGWPYPSLVQVATDAAGRPLLLLSDLAEHTRNLGADGRVGLLFDGTAGLDEPLAGARLSLLGRAAATADPADRARYLARFPGAAMFADFKDFRFYRVAPERAHLVAGFGRIHWVAAAGLVLDAGTAGAAQALEAGVIEHMNRDHADALILYARVLGGLEAAAAEMVGVDRLGFKLRIRAADGLHGRRIGFPREVTTVEQCRAVLIEMLADLRTGPR